MEINTIIEIQFYGDFDVRTTNCIMVHSDKLDVNEILNEFYRIHGITSNTGLSDKVLRTVTEDFICFLEFEGFNKLKTKPIYFCD